MSVKKMVVILAEGFEETEAVAVADMLDRCQVGITLAGLDSTEVRGSHGFRITADTLLDSCKPEEFDAVFLPGGLPGSTNLLASPAVRDFITSMAKRGAVVSAICAAPIVLAAAGLLDGKTFTMYPGFDQYLNGLKPTANLAECDGNIVTGKGPGAVFATAEKLAQALGLAGVFAEVKKSAFIKE